MKTNVLTWAKRILPIMALAVVGLMFGCKPDPEPEPEPIDPVKVLPFGEKIGLDAIQYDNVMKYANDPRIEKIIYFLDSTNDNYNYTGYDSKNILVLRSYLQECLDYTPKATGAGTFWFRKKGASVEDSLWFVANGWKISTR